MGQALEQLQARLERLEGEAAVRRLMARYMDLCDVPRDSRALQAELAELFAEDAVWEGLGARAGQSFGRHEGRDQWNGLLPGGQPFGRWLLKGHGMGLRGVLGGVSGRHRQA